MAISVYFNNKKITLPGAYSTIAAGDACAPTAFMLSAKLGLLDMASSRKIASLPAIAFNCIASNMLCSQIGN